MRECYLTRLHQQVEQIELSWCKQLFELLLYDDYTVRVAIQILGLQDKLTFRRAAQLLYGKLHRCPDCRQWNTPSYFEDARSGASSKVCESCTDCYLDP